MSDSTSSEEEAPVIDLTEKGRRMAKSIASYILMKYFFPNIKD